MNYTELRVLITYYAKKLTEELSYDEADSILRKLSHYHSQMRDAWNRRS